MVTADVLEIYMQEFGAIATVHYHSIQFKMDNKKHIINLESFREMLHICPRLPHQPFVEPPFEEEILAFLWFLGHSGAIRRLTNVNINKLQQPWRSFAAIVNKCLTRKSSGYDILRNSNAYKEYYAIATGATSPKPKASVRKTRGSSDTTITPPTAAADERTGSIPGVPDIPTDDDDEQDDDEDNNGEEGNDDDDDDQEDDKDDNEDDEEKENVHKQASDEEEFICPSLSTHAEEKTKDMESFDPILKTPENSDDEGNGEENLETNVGREEAHDEEEKEDELYRDVNINQGRGIQTTQEFEDSHVILTPVNLDGQQQSSSRMNEAVKVAVQIQSDRLCDEAQVEKDEFLKTIDENMQKIIKEKVKEQVKVQVSKILPRIEQAMNEQLKAKVLTVTLKRRQDDDADKDEEPSAGPDRGSKRRREGKELESSAPTKTTTRSAGRSTQGSRSRQASASESAFAEEPMQTTTQLEEPSHPEFDAGADDQPIAQSS
nr:hypothetical protein [Tanacetum cinerariifolium]